MLGFLLIRIVEKAYYSLWSHTVLRRRSRTCLQTKQRKRGYVMKYLKDWKVHALCFVMVIVSELIGKHSFSFGPVGFTLFPMLYALIIGIILAQFKLIDREMMTTASPYITISVMYLTAKMASSIGPNLEAVLNAGPALILQEFGNLGTIFLELPIAVCVFKMGRAAVGASFSTSREGSIAIVGNLYGLDSPEGQGVMGAYITGTLLGTIFNGLMAGVLDKTGLFHPYALGMAAGTGSASMMSAALAPVVAAHPEMAGQIEAYAATSQVLTSVDGMYMSLFVAIPVTNWLYRVLKHEKKPAKAAK